MFDLLLAGPASVTLTDGEDATRAVTLSSDGLSKLQTKRVNHG